MLSCPFTPCPQPACGRLYRLPWRVGAPVARELLELFDLSEAAPHTVRSYSGGMRRDLDLAVSLVAQPSILPLDEPTTALDLSAAKRSGSSPGGSPRGAVRPGDDAEPRRNRCQQESNEPVARRPGPGTVAPEAPQMRLPIRWSAATTCVTRPPLTATLTATPTGHQRRSWSTAPDRLASRSQMDRSGPSSAELEMPYRGNSIVGSNPTLSAIFELIRGRRQPSRGVAEGVRDANQREKQHVGDSAQRSLTNTIQTSRAA